MKAEDVIITQQLRKQDNGASLRLNEPFCLGLVGVIGTCSHTAAAVMGNKIKHVPQLSERQKHEQSPGKIKAGRKTIRRQQIWRKH